MANINFPNDPQVNDIFTVQGKSYKWDGVKWVAKTTVDKTDVGLGNVQNFSIADQAEAEAGDVNNKYMTPLRGSQAIRNQAFKETYTTTIETTDTWTDQTGYYTLAKTVSGVRADDNPVADLDLSSATVADIPDILIEWSNIYRIQTTENTLTFYALEEPDFPENVTVSFSAGGE
jgi:hypothetical protein